MKKFLLSTMVAASALLALNASASTTLPVAGPITISWQGTFAFTNTSKETITTNKALKETNFIDTGSSSTKTITINDSFILDLLTNSFHTNFPAGAKLATDDSGHIYVVDKTGTNVILDPSSVLTLTFGNGTLYSGSYSDTRTDKQGTNSYTGSEAYTGLGVVTIVYNDGEVLDSLKLTTSPTTSFTLTGVATGAYDYSDHSEEETVNWSVPATGGSGTIEGVFYIIKGSTTFSARGISD